VNRVLLQRNRLGPLSMLACCFRTQYKADLNHATFGMFYVSIFFFCKQLAKSVVDAERRDVGSVSFECLTLIRLERTWLMECLPVLDLVRMGGAVGL
jgi:hypothetical protein